ncbi:Aste57867_16228 [Aphanomyces stellatus]|uniref:Aste57867_16228 protein n=1 Tax=Aphanomyces stellatus TaxID=120398 RepID=A0A485L600_9STRA|nr:hypothetical protein As57867_016171 [Aphanomyces stellatus]VFT93006.1 Aste57867_16228 [Aphanomyces stellatus]
MLRSTEKAKVQKKGRFTIIDLPPDEPSPSALFGSGLPLSPDEGRARRASDPFDLDDPSRTTRVKQKGRFTIIDLDPNTPSPERTLRKGFRDDTNVRPSSFSAASTPDRPRNATQKQPSAVSPPPPPPPIPSPPPPPTTVPSKPPQSTAPLTAVTDATTSDAALHHPTCCKHRSPLMRPRASSMPPPCTMLFPPHPSSDAAPPTSDAAPSTSSGNHASRPHTHIAIPLHQYKQQQTLLAKLVQENQEMRGMIEILQGQQEQIMSFAMSLKAALSPEAFRQDDGDDSGEASTSLASQDQGSPSAQ